MLRYSEDLTIDQIASTLGTGAGSVKTHLHRGLGALAERLGQNYDRSSNLSLGPEVQGLK